ncbi:piggyBac transposable element-derived protein 4-like [Stegodyphus dumicola]|uniref:piggyBac transposable element-derived protein 4-like n=1 Tax=Stegodyphus dumicola TaxID=202533 RepID=UPI0015AE93FA|nr:piggyBac transposable element-derived protein 4-like [Stegodyphus dumicola]
MSIFLALLLLQGIVQKPVERCFWSKRPILDTPFFGKIMTERRFSLIMKFLHFEDNSTLKGKNYPNPKLKNIHTLHEMIISNFKTVYIPEKDISIDESLIAYKGLLGWKQFIPSKRARFGIKLFQLCEAESGYIWNSIIYTGKGTTFHKDYDHYELSVKSVMTLIHDLLGKGYFLMKDNFYTSPELAELLINQKTDICRTLRDSRKSLPHAIKLQKVKKEEVIAFQKGKICVLKWKDKKPLSMLSTVHNNEMIETAKGKNYILKPSTVESTTKKWAALIKQTSVCLTI